MISIYLYFKNCNEQTSRKDSYKITIIVFYCIELLRIYRRTSIKLGSTFMQHIYFYLCTKNKCY